MGLTGLDIFKLLPKKNCGECGVPTCLAFAMKVANKIVEPEKCPHISDEALEKLSAEQAPPQKLFKIGEYSIGGELEIYRHNKKFYNQTMIMIKIDKEAPEKEIEKVKKLRFERVGEELFTEGIYIEDADADILKKISGLTEIPLIFSASQDKLGAIKDAARSGEIKNSLILIINEDTAGDAIDKLYIDAKEMNIPVVCQHSDLEKLAERTEKCAAAGVKNIIIQPLFSSYSDMLTNNITTRRAAIQKKFKNFGYPLLTDISGIEKKWEQLSYAVGGICKYSSILITTLEKGMLFPTLTMRQNIFTDPQKPLQMKPDIYKIGEPDRNSLVAVTTNFSLTYFIVSGEIENAGFNGYLILVDAEGMSVLTAWAANKFSAEIIARFMDDKGIEDVTDTRELIIPGYVANLLGDLEEKLPDWKITVGPAEAGDISAFLKRKYPKK